MEDPGDYELQKTELPPPARRSRSRLALWSVAVAGLVGLAVVGFFFVGQTQVRAPATFELPSAAVAVPRAESDRPLGPTVTPITLPPLGETDAVVRRLVGALSSHPGVAAWLATDGLIRRFVAAVENIATGPTPARHLPALKPEGAFRVIERDEELLVDPRSYERYSQLAGVFESIDAAGAASVFALLKPRLAEAYRELGRQGTFDGALERAITMLLQVPVLGDDVTVTPKGALYVYEDPGIEQLTAAQKQLARMGRRNVRVIQAKLRQVALALGMRVGRLPA